MGSPTGTGVSVAPVHPISGSRKRAVRGLDGASTPRVWLPRNHCRSRRPVDRRHRIWRESSLSKRHGIAGRDIVLALMLQRAIADVGGVMRFPYSIAITHSVIVPHSHPPSSNMDTRMPTRGCSTISIRRNQPVRSGEHDGAACCATGFSIRAKEAMPQARRRGDARGRPPYTRLCFEATPEVAIRKQLITQRD